MKWLFALLIAKLASPVWPAEPDAVTSALGREQTHQGAGLGHKRSLAERLLDGQLQANEPS